jgi:uncharacterized protein (TIGR03083 family)
LALVTALDYLSCIDRESRRFADALTATDPAAPVPTCPEWSASDLLWHLTETQWFWSIMVADRLDDPAAAQQGKPERPAGHAASIDLFATATRRLLDALADGPDDTPVWTWADDQTLGFVRRRQAHEALIHRLDAELTGGRVPTALDATLSADGVDEILGALWGVPDWAAFHPGGGDLVLATTDTGHAWRVTFGRFVGTSPNSGRDYDAPTLVLADPAQPSTPDAQVRGPAAHLDRWLWGRGDLGLERSGDPAVLARIDELVAQGQ